MQKLLRFIPLLLIAFLGVESSKIDKSLQDSLLSGRRANIFVGFQEGTKRALSEIQSALSALHTQTEKATIIHKALKNAANNSQKEVLAFLQAQRIPSTTVKSFWINNQVYIQNASASLIDSLIQLDSVFRIQEEQTTHIENFLFRKSGSVIGRPREVSWGLEKIRIPEVWEAAGVFGEGLVIGNIDTGVLASHELLRDKWVGLENHGWFDPEGLSSVPHDVYNHGTMTMGVLVGDNDIGIAPAATWIACKGYRDNGSGATSTFLACGEYMLCPVDFEGNNPDCSKGANIVSNSWGFSGGDLFDPILEAWDAAGILSSFAAGNLYGCDTIYNPATRPGALAVGATEHSDNLLDYSSKGPGAVGLKPDVSAPGTDILTSSADADDAYMQGSGTSIACPITSGVLALLKSYDPNLTQEEAADVLTRSAFRIEPTGASCGGVPDSVYPNNHVGHGRVDAFEAFQLLVQQRMKQD